MNNKIKFGFDIDGCCLDFGNAFIKECKSEDIDLSIGKVWNFFDQDIKSYDIFKNLNNKFWLNLKREHKSLDLNVTPHAYISHRSCPVQITRQSLLNAGFPDAPVFHVANTEDKVKVAKQLGINVFVDDRASTICYFQENGIEAYILDQVWNEDYICIPRIKTLGELNKLVGE